MGDIFVYILKSSLCLAVFYLFFMAALSRETLYRFNRIVIVTLFLLALALPLVTLSVGSETPYSGVALNLEALIAMAETDTSQAAETSAKNSLLVWVFTLYIIGVVIAFIKSIVSLLQMIGMLRLEDSECSEIKGGVTLVIHNRNKAPFSWMKYIVISRGDYNESGEEIITHELAHISNRHSLDLLAAEMIKIVHWFNPAAYLLKRELQNIHEYQADEAVINHGIDAKKYQLLLIKKAVGDRLYSMANSFNQSKLKNRITMISKKKSQKRAALKALFLLPLSMFAVAAFATEEVTEVLAPVSELKVTDFIQKDTIKTKTKTIIVKGLKNDENVVWTTSEDDQNTVSDTAKIKKQVKVFVYNRDSVVNNANVKSNVKVAAFTTKSGDSTNVIVFVDGIEKDAEIIKQIDSKDISEVRVFKGEKAMKQYGEKGKDGVIVITTKNMVTKPDSKSDTYEKSATVETIVVRSSDKNANPLYVIDGIVQEKGNLDKIDPKTIATIDVLKGEAATRLYGDKGKDGVILITLKK